MSSAPASTPNTGLENHVSILVNEGESFSGSTAPDIMFMPYISIAKPKNIVPSVFFLSDFATIIKAMPITASIGEKEVGFNILIKKLSPSSPERESIHAVMVVPIFAPMITPIA